jgi:arginyl-tRNA synthetase
MQQVANAFANPSFGKGEASDQLAIVEYSSPNTNKPLHLGHLRNIFLGYSVSNILNAAGQKVVKTQIINDRGIHICKSMLAWQRFGNGETPESTGMKGDHLVGKYYVIFDQHYKQEIAELVASGTEKEQAEKEAPILLSAQEMLRQWEAGNEEVVELWKTMNGRVYKGFDATYKAMGVDFDQLYYESDTFILGKKVVQEGLEKGVFFRKDDGSVWIDLTDDGLDEKLLLRKDGTAVYMTQDIGTAIQRFEDFPAVSRMIYTVGNEQDYHFKVLFLILQKLGYEWAKECYHLSYGMVELPEGKMKSREGTVVDADDLMKGMVDAAYEETEQHGTFDDLSKDEANALSDMIGKAALKYFLLKVDPKKKMTFNPKESIDLNGNTGPFIQYAHARIKSIERKAGNWNQSIANDLRGCEKELDLAKTIAEYPQVIQDAAKEYSPAVIANYVYDLVKTYNSFYQSTPIFKADSEEEINWRVMLSVVTGRIIASGMNLLGIQVPERM